MIIIKILLLLLLSVLTATATLTQDSIPDFSKYPNLQLQSSMQIHDFSEPIKITYYYNTIETTIQFNINQNPFSINIKDVSYDKYLEEYALVNIGGSNYNEYLSLYQGKEVELELLNEKITILAESIIDHDNIEYLIIRGISEPKNIEVEKFIIDTPKTEIIIEEPIIPIETKEETNDLKTILIYLIILNIIFVLIIIYLIYKRNKY